MEQKHRQKKAMHKEEQRQTSSSCPDNQPAQIARKYRKISLWLTAGMVLAILFACRVSAQCDSMIVRVVNPLCVSAIFSLVCNTAYGACWQSVAKSSPANLAKFYLAASVLKMMAAALVFLVYVLLGDRSNLLGFTAIFMLFYVVMLIFDCIYFVRVEKKSRLT